MKKPLDGVTVVEVAMWAYVPSAGAILREWGAEVIKIEHPVAGDPIRGLSIGAVRPGEGGVTFMWEIFNRGKKSVGVDLATPEGHEVLLSLVAGADVFLTSLLPSGRKSLGIDVDELMAVKPDLIYAIGSGYGPQGDEAGKGGFDQITFWSRGGMAAGLGRDGAYPPMMPAGAFGDVISGSMLAGGVAAAIAGKARTGEGSIVDSSLLASAVWAVQAPIAGTAVTGRRAMPGFGREDVSTNPLVNVYRTGDGRYLSLAVTQSQRYWEGFCTALGRADLVDDPRFATADAREANCAECVATFDEIFGGMTLGEAEALLSKQEGQWDSVRLASELRHDAQVLANNYIQTVDYESGTTLPMASAPVQFDRSAGALAPAPEVGEHTELVLLDHGYDWDQMSTLKEKGAIS